MQEEVENRTLTVNQEGFSELREIPLLRPKKGAAYLGGDTHSHLPLEHRHCEPRKRQISRCRSRIPKRRKADKRMGRNDP